MWAVRCLRVHLNSWNPMDLFRALVWFHWSRHQLILSRRDSVVGVRLRHSRLRHSTSFLTATRSPKSYLRCLNLQYRGRLTHRLNDVTNGRNLTTLLQPFVVIAFEVKPYLISLRFVSFSTHENSRNISSNLTADAGTTRHGKERLKAACGAVEVVCRCCVFL